MARSLSVVINPYSLGGDWFHHGKNVQIHSKFNET